MRKSQILEDTPYAVVCAGGKTGSKIVSALLNAGKKVRAIDINSHSLSWHQREGAEVYCGSLTDAAFMKHAFWGVQAAFVMIPPDYSSEDYVGFQKEVATILTDAIRFQHVPYVINLSVLGAEIDAAPKIFRSLYEFEQQLNSVSGINVIHIRSAYFMENLLSWMHLIRESGMFGSPFRPKLSFPMISVHDVARKVYQLMLHLAFEGNQVFSLLGKQRIHMEQVSALLGKHLNIGRLPYIWIPYRDAKRTMLSKGVSNNVADLYLEMYEKINEGIVLSNVLHRSHEPIQVSMEEFIKQIFLPIYEQQMAS